MKTLRATPVVAALAATLALGTILSAQEPDSAGAGRVGDEPMTTMRPGQIQEDMEMPGMMSMMRMMRACMEMMESMGTMDSMGMRRSMGTMESMDSMREDPEEALRHSDDLGLSKVQVERLAEARDQWRASRNAAMERMREAHEAMQEATAGARERTREVLTPGQLDRLSELTGSSMEACPMHRGAERGSEAEEDESSVDRRNP